MKEVFEKIAQTITTKEEVLELISQINIAKELIYRNPSLPFQKRSQKFTSLKFKKILTILEKIPDFKESAEKQIEVLENLKSYLLSLPTIKLTFAFLPDQPFINQIVDWLREVTKKKLILDIFINPHIIGGLIIEYEGKYLDLSLSKRIKKAIKNNG